MRTAFIQQLIAEARTNKDIFLLTGDLGFSVLEPFAEEFPDRYLNVGIAEQNMAGIAAGLAMNGYCVFMYSIGNFPTLRCIEQIRYDICYHNLNVKVIAVGGGFAYGSLGASHHATEELGMMRAIPNMLVCAPGDPHEARAITSFVTAHKGPAYIRIGKAGEPNVHTTQPVLAQTGEIIPVIKGSGTAVLSTGAMLKYAADYIKDNGLNASLYSFPFVKPIREDQLLEILQQYPNIITIEEHQKSTGFGSAVIELANDFVTAGKLAAFPGVRRLAIQDTFYSVAGSQQYLRDQAGITLSREYFR